MEVVDVNILTQDKDDSVEQASDFRFAHYCRS